MNKEQNNRKNLLVVVIEDNDGDFILVEDYLIESFKTVHVTRCESFVDLEEFAHIDSEITIDLILLDLHLPDFSGMELIEKIVAKEIQVPVIILTGYADINLAKESLKLGLDDFLIKDEITPGILHKSIEFALSRKQYFTHIEEQNAKLRNIAWTQSHVVRAPLARILGIINVIETEKDSLDDLMFWISQLRVSCDEMDVIVRKITEEAQGIQLNQDNE